MNWLFLLLSAAHAQEVSPPDQAGGIVAPVIEVPPINVPIPAQAQLPDPNDPGGSVPAQGTLPVIEVAPVPVPEEPDQADGYVPPNISWESYTVEGTPWLDIYNMSLFGLKEGAYMASQVIPILMLLLVSYAIIRWMNRRFRQSPNDSESNQTRIINNTGDLILLPKAHAETENGIVVINLPSRTHTLEQPNMTLPMEGRLIAETSDGDQIELAAGEGQRVLHALATLAHTPVGSHVTIRLLRTVDGEELWRSPVTEQS